MRINTVRSLIFLAAAFLMIIYLQITLFSSPPKEPAALTAFVERYESFLTALAGQYPDQYKTLNHIHGLYAIDTRSDDVLYFFSWSHDIPEGESFVYCAKDGVVEYSGYSFSDDTDLEGLGINGKGYLKCICLRENWFFIEYCIPT